MVGIAGLHLLFIWIHKTKINNNVIQDQQYSIANFSYEKLSFKNSYLLNVDTPLVYFSWMGH